MAYTPNYQIWDRVTVIVVSVVFFAFVFVLIENWHLKEERREIMDSKPRGRIGRQIYETICTFEYYDSNNVKHSDCVRTLYGNYDIEAAHRKLTRLMGTQRLMISSIDYRKYYASTTIEKFIKIADIISAD